MTRLTEIVCSFALVGAASVFAYGSVNHLLRDSLRREAAVQEYLLREFGADRVLQFEPEEGVVVRCPAVREQVSDDAFAYAVESVSRTDFYAGLGSAVFSGVFFLGAMYYVRGRARTQKRTVGDSNPRPLGFF